ncbi:2-octaprenyl-3-methyl-6-methoxy-1,4-benzoquinol hydroxylase [archaeon HR01]|nr:2-octaprenyl-3-methyl-6-methoxy-1,4-benzoquinol hydroxylase [archaeon HR01]
MSLKVVICGGGVAGAAMAAALANTDYSVLLLEKEGEEFLGRSSGGETLRAETCRSFDRLGVLDDILRHSHSIRKGDRRELHHVAKGMLGHFRYDAFAPEYPVVHTHHNYIVEGIHRYIERSGASNVEARFGCEVVDVGEYRDGRREVVYKDRKSGELRSVEADLVIGADGGNSVVRRSIGIQASETDLGISYLMFYVERLSGFEYGRFTVGPHGFIGIFPSSENTLRLAVEVRISELGGWTRLDGARLRERWALRDPALKEAKLVKRGLPFHIIKRLSPTYVREGACIIGDAAHVPPPILGMGISLALNDVLALQKVLLEPVGESLSLENLRRFEEMAAPYNVRWVETNHRLYLWLNEMCADPNNFHKIPLGELAQMGFHPSENLGG